MTYAIRNSIILGILLLLVFFSFLIANATSQKEYNKTRKNYEDKLKVLDEIKATNPYIKNEEQIIDSLETMKKIAFETSKHIPADDNPTLTYQYLLNICHNHCPGLSFDFELVNAGDEDSVYFNIYSISGEGKLSDIYSFINQIENQYYLIIVDAFNLTEFVDQDKREGKAKKISKVSFSMDLKVYFSAETGTKPDEIPTKKIEYSNIKYNPFISRIYQPFKDDKEEKFINIYEAKIVGLTKTKVFIQGPEGHIVTLLPGGKVAYGFLDHIDWEDQSVVFKMNEIGVVTEKILYVEEEETL